ncbi:MAG: TIR domain-containing protein [Vicinamibacterales bacterium]
MGDIFISYSRSDHPFVDDLIQELEENGFGVWVDRQDIRGGTQWRAAITQAIRDCEAFLVVLSPNSTGSKNVGRELELAADNNRPIIPIVCGVCEIPSAFAYHFAGVQRIEFPDGSDSKQGVDRLIDAIRAVTAAEPATAGGGTKKRAPAPASSRRPDPAPDTRNAGWPAPAAPQGTQTLAQLLPGRWHVQIHNPMMGTGVLTLDLAPNGVFQGQLMKPFGMTRITGQWQATVMNQLMLQGQETNGFQVIPYATMIQFTQIDAHQLAGATMAGEQTFMKRMG